METLTTKTRQTQYRLKSHPTNSHTLPFQLRPISRNIFLRLSVATSRTICCSTRSMAETSTSRLLRWAAAGFDDASRERSDCDAAESASRCADPCASLSDRSRCWRSRRAAYSALSAWRICASVTGSLRTGRGGRNEPRLSPARKHSVERNARGRDGSPLVRLPGSVDRSTSGKRRDEDDSRHADAREEGIDQSCRARPPSQISDARGEKGRSLDPSPIEWDPATTAFDATM